MRRATAAMVSFARLADGPGAVRGPRTWAGLPRVSKEMQPSCGQMGPFRPWSARRCWALGRPNAAPLNNHHMCRCRAREAFTLSQPPVAIPPIRPVAPFLWIPSDPAIHRHSIHHGERELGPLRCPPRPSSRHRRARLPRPRRARPERDMGRHQRRPARRAAPATR